VPSFEQDLPANILRNCEILGRLGRLIEHAHTSDEREELAQLYDASGLKCNYVANWLRGIQNKEATTPDAEVGRLWWEKHENELMDILGDRGSCKAVDLRGELGWTEWEFHRCVRRLRKARRIESMGRGPATQYRAIERR
jgi:hypothetical protein